MEAAVVTNDQYGSPWWAHPSPHPMFHNGALEEAVLPARPSYHTSQCLSNNILRMEVDSLYSWANRLHSGISNLYDVQSEHHNNLASEVVRIEAEYVPLHSMILHVLDEHVLPMQGVLNLLFFSNTLRSGSHPNPAFLPFRGGCHLRDELAESQRPVRPEPPSPTSDSSNNDSCPSLLTVSSSDTLVSSKPGDLRSSSPSEWSLLTSDARVVWVFKEEIIVSSPGAEGESVSLQATTGSSSGSSATYEDAGEDMLPESAEGAQDSSGAGVL